MKKSKKKYKEKLPSLKDAVEFRREQYGWTKTVMARELHISLPNYSDFIHGRRGLPFIAIKHAYRIGIPATVLLQINGESKHLNPNCLNCGKELKPDLKSLDNKGKWDGHVFKCPCLTNKS